MVIAAHADDIEFSCSGTMAKYVKEGKDIIYVILSAGEKGNKIDIPKSEIVEVRKKEQREAAEIIGVKNLIFLDYEDGVIENNEELRKELVRLIRQNKPDVIFTFDPDCHLQNFYVYHSDHRETGIAVFDAASPRAGNKYYYSELNLEPHRIEAFYFFGSDKQNEFIDITDFIDLKIKALTSYKSQMPDEINVEKFVRKYAEDVGKKIDVKYAEGFRKVERMKLRVE